MEERRIKQPVRTKHHRGRRRRRKQTKQERFLSNIILICAVAIFLVSAYKLIRIGFGYTEGRSEYKEVVDLVVQYEKDSDKFVDMTSSLVKKIFKRKEEKIDE